MTQGIVSARSTSEQATSRRALLRGAADLGTPVALGVPAASAGEAADSHLAWYAEWKAAIDYMDGPACRRVEKIFDLPVWHRALELESLIGTTPARGAAGARDQLRMLHHWCAESLPNDDMEAALENALATVERLAGGQATASRLRRSRAGSRTSLGAYGCCTTTSSRRTSRMPPPTVLRDRLKCEVEALDALLAMNAMVEAAEEEGPAGAPNLSLRLAPEAGG
jgi:hypothetical protein